MMLGGSHMSADGMEQCFDSIESVQDFMRVVAETALDANKDLDRDHRAAVRDGEERRARAIELAQYKLKMLNCYVYKSRMALNDLRSLRRLILNERQPLERAMAAG
jgi:hypothetical protein